MADCRDSYLVRKWGYLRTVGMQRHLFYFHCLVIIVKLQWLARSRGCKGQGKGLEINETPVGDRSVVAVECSTVVLKVSHVQHHSWSWSAVCSCKPFSFRGKILDHSRSREESTSSAVTTLWQGIISETQTVGGGDWEDWEIYMYISYTQSWLWKFLLNFANNNNFYAT